MKFLIAAIVFAGSCLALAAPGNNTSPAIAKRGCNGYGGLVRLWNHTPYVWQRTYQHSYQMNYWDNNFPAYIHPGDLDTMAQVYIEFSADGTQTDTGAEVNYYLVGSDAPRGFQVQARVGGDIWNGYDYWIVIQYLDNLSTITIPAGGVVSIPFQINGIVSFDLTELKHDVFNQSTAWVPGGSC